MKTNNLSREYKIDYINEKIIISNWLRDYLFEECFDDLIDIGEDDLPIAC